MSTIYRLGQVSSTAWRSEDAPSEIEFLETYSAELGPVQAHNTAAALHAQADTVYALFKDTRHSLQRFRTVLSEKSKQLVDQKKYAKRIAATIADDRLVLERKETLIKMPTGNMLLKAATDELAVMRNELKNINALIAKTSRDIAMNRKIIAVQDASASQLSNRLSALLQRVREADFVACEQASRFASTKVLTLKGWYDEATANSKKALEKLQNMVLKCADGKCSLLPVETATATEDASAAIEPDYQNYTNTEETSTPPPLRSSLLAKLEYVLSNPNGLLDMLSTTQTKLREFEDGLDVARKALSNVKDAERESVVQAQALRFQQTPVNETDTRIASLARDVVRQELIVHRLIAKIALERAAFNAVKDVAKTREMQRQMLRMHQLELKSQGDLEKHCARLRSNTGIAATTSPAAEITPDETTQPQQTEIPGADEMF